MTDRTLETVLRECQYVSRMSLLDNITTLEQLHEWFKQQPTHPDTYIRLVKSLHQVPVLHDLIKDGQLTDKPTFKDFCYMLSNNRFDITDNNIVKILSQNNDVLVEFPLTCVN